jgi:hypothetical protein
MIFTTNDVVYLVTRVVLYEEKDGFLMTIYIACDVVCFSLNLLKFSHNSNKYIFKFLS